ncbi:MAG: DNA mismatch repair endonuclease MutL [Acutalibacteraceae bacterium]|nr:DNA mismatch repair endonuclease MutL [Acutalibacteraceae bacterium]
MPKINVLPKYIAEKIAAGEVVEKPASVIKEILENAIDAGATDITVEIKGGGILYMRVTDNGCGIKHDDVPTAFLRHATSKITKEDDLNSINSLGFRGEALAAISSVSKVELITRTAEDVVGSRYVIEGGQEIAFEETGCEEGTTVIVRDLFFNTPARMKFLKKDTSEANIIADLVEKIALSHPEIAIRFIRDSKTVITTTGDGKLQSAIYSVLGREFTSTLIDAKGGSSFIKVSGYVCKPVYCRPKRTGQYFFLNGRTIKSTIAMSALEAAYKNSVMVGKFPACVLNIEVDPAFVDVNVHPAKTEVRFSDDKAVFDAVYFTVKNALESGDTRPQISMKSPASYKTFDRMTAQEYKQSVISEKTSEPVRVKDDSYERNIETVKSTLTFFDRKADEVTETSEATAKEVITEKNIDEIVSYVPVQKAEEIKPEVEPIIEEKTEIIPDLRLIGEAFSTYIIVEKGNSVYFIDKHASHERIIFEELKKTQTPQCQQLLLPVTVKLSAEHYNAVTGNVDLLLKSGFEVDDFGSNTVIVRGVPANLTGEDTNDIFYEVADSLLSCGGVEIEKLDSIFHTVACKAAIKAGYRTDAQEMLRLATEVLSREDIMYCPHGRPVAFEINKRDLEKQFGRIQ